MQPDGNDIVYTQYGPNFLGLFRRILEALTGNNESIVSFLSSAWHVYSIIAFIVSAVLIYGIIYSYIRLNQWSEIDADNLEREEKLWQELHGSTQENRRWSEIQKHISSENPNDWKLSIIEADIILGETLHAAGYAGQSIGEQLKSASVTNFKSLQDAWDAHLMRNRIAHEGADFILTKTMVKEAMIKYQRVFREFEVI